MAVHFVVLFSRKVDFIFRMSTTEKTEKSGQFFSFGRLKSCKLRKNGFRFHFTTRKGRVTQGKKLKFQKKSWGIFLSFRYFFGSQTFPSIFLGGKRRFVGHTAIFS
jgi:hypothetical protein